MKKIISLIILGLLSIAGYSQMSYENDYSNDMTLLKNDSLGQIRRIEKEVGKVNTNELKMMEIAKDKNGYRHDYFIGNDLKLVQVYYNENDIEKNVSWYFNNGQIIYSTQLWTNHKTKDTIDNERLYFYYENLIAWTKNGKPVDENSSEFKKVGVDLKEYAHKLKSDWQTRKNQNKRN
jgi:hypothetical protein